MCTGIEIISTQGNPYWGRTQDFEREFEYAGMKIPAGTHISSTYTPFDTKVAVMGIAWAQDVHAHPVILDGINDAGICGGSFYFDHWYRYIPKEAIETSGKTALRGEELVTWILTHYRSLDDIKEHLGKDVGIVADTGPMMGMSVPADDVDAVNEVFQLLTVVNNPKGALRVMNNGVTLVPWTQYTSAYDIKHRTLYGHTYENRNVRKLEFGDPNEWEHVRYYDFCVPQTYEEFVEEEKEEDSDL